MYTRTIKLPRYIRDTLKSLDTVPNMSKRIEEILHTYAGNLENTHLLLLRRLQRQKKRGVPTDSTFINTSVKMDPALYEEFSKVAKVFDQSFDYLLQVAIEDYLLLRAQDTSLYDTPRTTLLN